MTPAEQAIRDNMMVSFVFGLIVGFLIPMLFMWVQRMINPKNRMHLQPPSAMKRTMSLIAALILFTSLLGAMQATQAEPAQPSEANIHYLLPVVPRSLEGFSIAPKVDAAPMVVYGPMPVAPVQYSSSSVDYETALSMRRQTAIPVPTLDFGNALSSVISNANTWTPTFAPIFGIGYGIQVALAILGLIGTVVVGAIVSAVRKA